MIDIHESVSLYLSNTNTEETEMITTTLKQLRDKRACYDGYNKLVRAIQGKEFTAADSEKESYIRFAHKDDITIRFILDANGLDDAVWSLRACKQNADLVRKERLFAVWCARQVQHLIADERRLLALDVAERHANGLATDNELSAARAAEAARAAAEAARAAAGGAAWDAARAAQKGKFIEMFCAE